MTLEFALRPRFDLNRPPKRRRFSGLELPPLALPIAAYWLAIAGGTYALVRSRAPDASNLTQHDTMSESSRVTEEVSNDVPAAWNARSEIGPSAAVATSDALEPSPVAAPEEQEPRSQPVVTAAPRAAAAPERVFAPQKEAPVHARREAKALESPARYEPIDEPVQRKDEIPSGVLGADTPKRAAPPTALPSCESAADAGNQTIELGARRGALDLTRDAFAAVLENGTYLTPCGIPARTALEVCAAVQDGRVVGVTVTTEPRDAAISACVRRAVAALRFPRNPQLDVTRTRFESAR